MKKSILVTAALLAVFSLAACGDEESAEIEAAEEAKVEEKAVTKEFGNISVTVPAMFEDVKETDGFYVAAGPNASVTVTPVLEVELPPTEWNEELAIDSLELLYGEVYMNMSLASYEGQIDLNGNPSVYYSFYGTTLDGEQEHLVHIVRLFNPDVTAQYLVNFIYKTEDTSYTADVTDALINSITLSSAAQGDVAQ